MLPSISVIVHFVVWYSTYSVDSRSLSKVAQSRNHSSCSKSIRLVHGATILTFKVRSGELRLAQLPITIRLMAMPLPNRAKRKLPQSNESLGARSMPSGTRIFMALVVLCLGEIAVEFIVNVPGLVRVRQVLSRTRLACSSLYRFALGRSRWRP